MNRRSLFLVMFFSLFVTGIFGQEESKSMLNVSAYVDAYYQYNTNNPLSGSNSGRVFDLAHDNIALGLVQTKLDYTNKKSNAVIDLTFGANAEYGNFGNAGSAISIKQAYFTYNITDKLDFTIGQYGTHIGYELIDAPLNFNYSLSYLFGNGPFYHTGAKLDFTLNDKVSFMAGVVNGWDALLDFNDKKSFALQASLVPVEGWNVYLNWIGGDEYGGVSAFGETSGSYTSLFDLTTSYEITLDTASQRKMVLGLNAALGQFNASPDAVADDASPYDENAVWGGAAVYLNYYFNETIGLGARVEYFSDEAGVRYFGPLSVLGLTLTGDISLANGSINIKPEIRFDKNNNDFFEDRNGGLKAAQATLGASFIYNFGKDF